MLINELDSYTLEAIMVHTLAILFNSVDNSLSVVRVSTLLDRLDTPVRNVALTLAYQSG